MERETGFEPATNGLEGRDSTPELLPPGVNEPKGLANPTPPNDSPAGRAERALSPSSQAPIAGASAGGGDNVGTLPGRRAQRDALRSADQPSGFA